MRGHTGGHRLFWRRTGWALAAGAVLAGATASEPGAAHASGRPPSAGAVPAATGQVASTSAELNAVRVQLAAADARLAGLRDQAEVIIERYDKTMVNLHQAAVAYQAAQQRLARASQAESASSRQVGAMESIGHDRNERDGDELHQRDQQEPFPDGRSRGSSCSRAHFAEPAAFANEID